MCGGWVSGGTWAGCGLDCGLARWANRVLRAVLGGFASWWVVPGVGRRVGGACGFGGGHLGCAVSFARGGRAWLVGWICGWWVGGWLGVCGLWVSGGWSVGVCVAAGWTRGLGHWALGRCRLGAGFVESGPADGIGGLWPTPATLPSWAEAIGWGGLPVADWCCLSAWAGTTCRVECLLSSGAACLLGATCRGWLSVVDWHRLPAWDHLSGLAVRCQPAPLANPWRTSPPNPPQPGPTPNPA